MKTEVNGIFIKLINIQLINNETLSVIVSHFKIYSSPWMRNGLIYILEYHSLCHEYWSPT